MPLITIIDCQYAALSLPFVTISRPLISPLGMLTGQGSLCVFDQTLKRNA